MARRIRFTAFQMNAASHQAPGLWRHERDGSQRYAQAGHWLELARLLERGCFDAVLFADVLGANDVYAGSPEAALRHGVQIPVNDPLALVPLMAQATRHLGFGVTCALAYEHPYLFARRMSTLDHLSQGRVGWNIATRCFDSADRNLGLARPPAPEERFELAEEYLEVVYKLWEASWEDDAVRRDRQGGVYTDPAKVHAIGHRGRYFDVPGIHLCEPSPQRTPLLLAQAGTSPRAARFAAQHAEGIFLSGPSIAVVRRLVEQVRQCLSAAGRAREDVLIYTQALIITAPTSAEAQAKHMELLRHVDVEGALALLSGWTGIDFSRHPRNTPIEQVDTNAGRTALAAFSHAEPARRWTVGEAARFIGLGGRGPVIVGSPQQVADQLQQWADSTGIDGFNLSYALAHETMQDVVDLVVPELQQRGRYATGYAEGTLRDKLFGRGPRLPASHIGRQVKLGQTAPELPVSPRTGAENTV
ncbi:LLM class flavin-dependent oxidoreductase [Azohydromonas caseinilytica]|uniref:LLM class flavin-dependent oxidoreductase n=1 Tax=Azohydromonas caseinilytica TaxID=2728836 RepID=A0A848FB09_9BURK|nr:LLM class flavin-dependent oxidoreductase [Azohydromonas caseinilytica]NML16512.1 LLM class flavin-dependent oxidoreductase [Azohydromonas caseinilytica]